MKYSDEFKTAVREDILNRIENENGFAEKFNSSRKKLDDDNLFRQAAYEAYAEKPEFKKYFGQKEEEGFLSRVGDDLSNIGKASNGIWETTKAFGRDLMQTPSEFVAGGQNTVDSLRLFKNFVEGDDQELESVYQNTKSRKPLSEAETYAGKVMRDVANMLPYLGTSASATAAGAAVAGPAGGLIGAASGEYAQGWGESYKRLRDEGVDPEFAKSISTLAAIPYAGLGVGQLRMIPGLKGLFDKYITGKIVKTITEKLSDKVFKGKVQRALGNYFGEVFTQSAQEGGQEMVMNAGLQYGRNGGFNNFDLGENVDAGAEAFKESIGPFAVIQGFGIPGHIARQRKNENISNVRNAVNEGRKLLDYEPERRNGEFEIPVGVNDGEIFRGLDGNLYRNEGGKRVPVPEANLAPEGNAGVAPADNAKPAPGAPILDSLPAFNPPVEKQQNVFGDIYNGARDLEQNSADYAPISEASFGAFLRRLKFEAEEKAKKDAEAEAQDKFNAKMDELAEEDSARRERMAKIQRLRSRRNSESAISKKIDKLQDPQMRLDAMDFEVENGNISKLSAKQLEDAQAAGYEWAQPELEKRFQEEVSGTPLLKILQEAGYKLPTPAAIIRHAKAHNRGLGTYLYGEIKDLYDSLPFNLRAKYFSKNYVNLDEVADELRDFGFNYDSEGDFISDVADNLSERRISYGFALAENDVSKMSDAELVDAHKRAFEANDEAAGRAIAEEWMRRRGYETQSYHGTGADGFNVADATSRHKEFGEGNQAHGPGLYMAANRGTAEAYKYNAPVHEFRTIGGKTFEEIGISPKELNYPVFGLVDFLHSNGVDKAKEIINTRIESQTKRLKSAEKHLPKSKNGFDRDLAWETIKSAKREISNDRITLDVIDKILSKLKENGLSISDYEYKISEGRVFDWFHNMKSDELLDEQNPNSVEKSAVGEKYKKAWFEDILPILRREYGYDGEEFDSVKRMLSFHNSAKTIARNGSTILGADRFREIMLKHGIRGITYDGRQDGRVFVSFEGGPAVKLQDAFTFDDNGNYIPLDQRGNYGNPDMRYSIKSGDYFNKAKNELPIDNGSSPNFLEVSGTDAELFQRAKEAFDAMPMYTRAADGVKIKLKVSEGGSMSSRIVHMISDNSTGSIAPQKLAWLPNVQSTIENAQVRLKGRYDARKQNRSSPNRIYIRRYNDGTIHAVVVSPYGEIVGQDIKEGGVITQYPVEKIGEIYNATVDWVNPKMTKASAETTEASQLKDLSHQGTVPLPEANGPTSKDSAIPDSRQLSMNAESEISPASQEKIGKIKSKIEAIQKKFNRKAKVKSALGVVETVKEAREILGAESLPYNAKGINTGNKIIVIAQNIEDSADAARVFLHEKVGHFGLRNLLGKDFDPFLEYVVKHYKGSNVWNKIRELYENAAPTDRVVAEELLAHLAENREISDPALWSRLVAKTRRWLKKDGVPEEYAKLLDEKVLRSAIVLSREWARGDAFLNENGIWQSARDMRKGKDVPEDDIKLALDERNLPSPEEIAEANRQKAEVKAKWTNPDGSMKKGYMLAPNGKPTNLSEDQWLLVRTPNFKKWFGDWEKEAWAKAAVEFLESTAPVASLTGREFQKDGVRLTDKVSAYFNSIGNVAHNEELGDVVLNLEGIRDSIAHGVGRQKAAAFMAVKDVIEKGFIFNRETNWKNRNYDSAVIIAPISINNTDYICEVVITRKPNENRFYLHEVEIKETLEKAFKTPTEGRASQASKLIIGKHLEEVKGNVSKVVDENGEPLVMYHGTEWNPLAEKSGNAAFKDESYFTDKKDYANRYKKDGKIYEFYLNLKKPFDTRNSKEKEIFEREFYRKWGNGAPLTERGLPDWTDGSDLLEFIREKGYDYDGIILDEGADGGYGKNVSYRGESYVPINSTQIKSATDNAGTFNPDNPDIRYSLDENGWKSEEAGEGRLSPRIIDPLAPVNEDRLSAAEIRRYFEKALNLPVRRQVHPAQRNHVGGTYNPKSEVVRTNSRYGDNDLGVLSHEIGHYLHGMMFGDRISPDADNFDWNPAVQKELADYITDKFGDKYAEPEKVGEGVAEFVRNWIMQPEAAAEKFPAFFTLFTRRLDKLPDLKRAMERGRELVAQSNSLPALEKVKNSIRKTGDEIDFRPLKERVKSWAFKFKTKMIDELAPLDAAADVLREFGASESDLNFIKYAVNHKGGTLGKAEYALMERATNFQNKEVGPGLFPILRRVGEKNIPDFEAYLVSRRTLELAKRGIKTGISSMDALSVVKSLKDKFEKHARRLDRYQDRQLKLLVDSGILSKDAYKRVKAQNMLYVPLHRFYEKNMGGGRGKLSVIDLANPLKRIKGSDLEIISPIESIIKNTFLFRDLAERNRVALSFVDACNKTQGGGRVADKFFKKYSATKLEDKEKVDVILESGIIEDLMGGTMENQEAYVRSLIKNNPFEKIIFRPKNATNPQEGIFRVFRDGEVEYYQMDDKDLYDALRFADSEQMKNMMSGKIWQFITAPTRILRAGATTTLEFGTKNFIRDMLTAGVYSKNGYVPVLSSAYGIFQVLTKGKWYREFLREGARYANFTAVDTNVIQNALRGAFKNDKTTAAYWLNFVKNPVAALRAYSELMESATRVAEYRLARKNDKSALDAANEAKSITLNFARNGKFGATLNRLIPFFNAGIQDTAKFFEEFVLNKDSAQLSRNWLKGFLRLSLPTIMLAYINSDDEEIKALPTWRKAIFWNFRIPGVDGIWSIPKPIGLLGIVFCGVPEAIVSFILSKDKKLAKEYLNQFLGMANPFDVPVAVKTPYELWANKSFFTGGRIESMSDGNILPSMRYGPNTSRTSILAADALSRMGVEVSPKKIDYTVRGYTAGLGTYALSGSDAILKWFSALDIPEPPDRGVAGMPIVKSFAVNPYTQSRYVGYLMDEYDKCNQTLGSARRIQDGRLAEKRDWINKNAKEVDLAARKWTILKNSRNFFSRMSAAEQICMKDRSLSAQERKERLMEISNLRNEFAKEAWEALKKIK
mgnify:CR=1 FL=1